MITKILHRLSDYWWHKQLLEDKKSENKRKEWVRVILDRNSDAQYLIRYYLFNTRFLEHTPFWWASINVVVHNTLMSDCDGYHDHPYWWISWILAGGYIEQTPEGNYWRYPGHLRFRKAKSFHRLVLDINLKKEVWSLFVMGPHIKEWGFLGPGNKWVQWEEYLNNKTV